MSTKTTIDIRQHILDTAQEHIAQKGFTAVGLAEILQAANVPKGSFYHYFASKDAFGVALLENYFCDYISQLQTLEQSSGAPASDRLFGYLENWLEAQSTDDPDKKCLAVKLAAEVSDLSEPMRMVLRNGTEQVIAKLARILLAGIADGSVPANTNAEALATTLYYLWLGACLHAKITRDREPLAEALRATRRLLE